MTTQWTRITPEQAARHHLYGIRNWLAVFAFGVLFGFLRELGEVHAAAAKAGLSLSAFFALDHPAVTFAKIGLAVEATGVGAIYWAMFRKHPKFRVIASWVLIGMWPLLALVGASTPFDGVGEALGLSFFPWVISCAVWVTYLQRSRRVRVTFEHLVRGEPTSLSPPNHHAAALASSTGKPVYPPLAMDDVDYDTSTPTHSAAVATGPVMTPYDHQRIEEELFAVALAELDTGSRRSGLWAKCYAATNGAEPEAKAMYLRERVRQLQTEQEEARAAETAQATERQAREDLNRLKEAFAAGSQPTPDQVRRLVAAAEADRSLVQLQERVRGETLLHWAARHDLAAESRRLLTLGADPCAGNASAQRPHMVAPSKELREILFEAAAGRGLCPNCRTQLLLTATTCPKCNAEFGEHSVWRVREVDGTLAAAPAETQAEVMRHYGITFDGEKWHYDRCRYDKFDDALAYAKRTRGKRT